MPFILILGEKRELFGKEDEESKGNKVGEMVRSSSFLPHVCLKKHQT